MKVTLWGKKRDAYLQEDEHDYGCDYRYAIDIEHDWCLCGPWQKTKIEAEAELIRFLRKAGGKVEKESQ